MEKRIIGLVTAFMLVLALAPTAIADELPADGTATVGNETPSVTSVAITDMSDGAASMLAPGTYYKVKVTVEDANSLEDISGIEVKMFLTAVSEGSADAVRNHYTFQYTAGTPTWEETGPDPTTDNHIDPNGCVEASPLTDTSGTYVFKVKLAYVAEPTTEALWTAWAIASDEGPSESETTTFDVNDYLSLGIDEATLTFSGAPGATGVLPSEQPTVATVTSNNIFNVNVRLSADWSGTEHGGSIPMANTKADMDGEGTYDVTLTDAYQTLWNNVACGEDLGKDCFWSLDIPSPQRDDSYTVIAYVQAVKV